ncbi:MAG: hypothetical protein FWE24_04860 [Defluviitaleaceae bacterium]|nr:hypothetical protein [Defluviitaleaceae bacterium]
MKREELIAQVKEEYASIASSESQQHFIRTTNEISSEAYYEKLLNAVIEEIEKGKFDNCRSGSEIVNKVAADKTVLSNWSNMKEEL